MPLCWRLRLAPRLGDAAPAAATAAQRESGQAIVAGIAQAPGRIRNSLSSRDTLCRANCAVQAHSRNPGWSRHQAATGNSTNAPPSARLPRRCQSAFPDTGHARSAAARIAIGTTATSFVASASAKHTPAANADHRLRPNHHSTAPAIRNMLRVGSRRMVRPRLATQMRPVT